MIKLSDELLRLVSNLVLKDVTTIAFCGLVIGIMLTFFGRALMEPYQFARNKLPNQSALLHAIRERSGTTLVALIIVAGMSAYAWSSVAAVVSHATPPWQAEEVCFRVPQQCRSCVAFLDQRGRVISKVAPTGTTSSKESSVALAETLPASSRLR